LSLDLFPYFLAWRKRYGPFDGSFFLDSFRAGGGARYSYFPLSPPEKIISASSPEDFPERWESLKKEIARLSPPAGGPGGPPFTGGAAGIISYDAGRSFEEGWRTEPPPDPLRFPLLRFGIYRDLACLDHREDRFHFFARDADRMKILRKRFEDLEPASPGTDPSRRKPASASLYKNRAWYLGSVKEIKGYISRGDIYQANLSQRFELPYKESGLELYSRLRDINPSPYACYFNLGRFEIASCSPELLIKVRGGMASTRPIAGTRPRGNGAAEDRRLEGRLLLSPKERAEHVMLLDLERNDLGRVCRAGTVKVTEKMAVEKYSHVMHIVSQVEGRLRKDRDVFDAIRAVFPGGTITGCPKVRCMEILDGIEPVARGPFFGAAGWLGGQGEAELNLLIRTGLVREGRLILQAGSGIVADSNPGKEYDESLHKAEALLSARLG